MKWASVAVSDFDMVPDGMETLVLNENLYAVFNYKGDQSSVSSFFNQIYTEWLPTSGYELGTHPSLKVSLYVCRKAMKLLTSTRRSMVQM